MNSKDTRGLKVVSIADGTQIGTVDEVYLDLAAKQVVGFTITQGRGPFGGALDNAPTVAASAVHALGHDALTLDDVTAAHAAWVEAAYGPLETLDALVGRKVITEGGTDVGTIATVEFDERTFTITAVEVSPGLFQTKTHIPLDQLVRFGPDVLVVSETLADSEPPTVAK